MDDFMGQKEIMEIIKHKELTDRQMLCAMFDSVGTGYEVLHERGKTGVTSAGRDFYFDKDDCLINVVDYEPKYKK